jgi:signal transduction histidine kinase
MFFAVIRTARLKKLLLGGPNGKTWKWLVYLMVFFLVGYVISIVLVLSHELNLLLTLTGLVFLMGALFVFLVISTAKSDIESINASHDKLLNTNEELTKKNKELDLFTYSITHDLRSPIASIRGLVDIAKLNSSREEVDYCLQNIASSTTRLDAFINDVLNVTMNARGEVVRERFDFGNIVKAEINDLQHSNNDGPIEFDNKVPHGTFIFSDSLRVKIILHNLLSNAVKYHRRDEPGRFVRVSCSSTDSSFKFTVTDNGSGIIKSARKNVFKMFYRATDSAKGSGLGLYIVKEIVDKLEGKISFTSEVDQGTEFTVSIPY